MITAKKALIFNLLRPSKIVFSKLVFIIIYMTTSNTVFKIGWFTVIYYLSLSHTSRIIFILSYCKKIKYKLLYMFFFYNYHFIIFKLTGDRLTVFVFDYPSTGIWLSNFRFVVRIATGCGHVGCAVRWTKNRSGARQWWRWVVMSLMMLFMEKPWRNRRKRLMRYAHIAFSDVQSFHELLWSPMQIFQRHLKK